VRLGVIPSRGGETVWIRWDADRYPYLASIRWTSNAPLTLLVQDRTQTEQVLLAADPATGRTEPLLIEADPAWLNLDQNVPRWLDDGSAFVWQSERSGEPKLELRARDGALLRTLTPAGFGLHELVSVDAQGREAIVLAAAQPTQRHLYRVQLDGSVPPQALAAEAGIHGAAVARDHGVYVHWADTPSGRTPYSVRRADGSAAGSLASAAEAPPFLPALELTTVGKGTEADPQFHVALVRPRDFDRTRSYPVVEHVYGGPTGTMVSAAASKYLLDQWIADHGFVVVAIDARGTPHRGRAWERAIRGDLIGLPLQDHVAALQALGVRYPELDLGRVGIYGWSFGGYFAAMAVLRRPDVYHAAVAGAPVADWMDYDTHYTERYLGLPQDDPEAYRRSSVLTYAAALSRPLLLIHGTTDDNVYFLHSLKISDALFRAGRPHDFLPLSNYTHMVADPAVRLHLNARIVGYFRQHLLAPASR
jgi:dipeptidyl-peptidase-4